MKNISRRVFIKGLAVAGVAAAASTVLAGCNTNMIPGIDNDGEGEVETPAATVLEFVDADDKDKTLKVTATKLTVGNTQFGEDQAAITLRIENNLGQDLYFLDADAKIASTSNANVLDGTYYLFVEAYADDQTGKEVTVKSDTGIVFTHDTNEEKVSDKTVATEDVYLDLVNVTVDSSISLKVTVKKVVNQEHTVVRSMGDKTFTYKV